VEQVSISEALYKVITALVVLVLVCWN
jgi:hypothetical protein